MTPAFTARPFGAFFHGNFDGEKYSDRFQDSHIHSTHEDNNLYDFFMCIHTDEVQIRLYNPPFNATLTISLRTTLRAKR